MDTFLGHDLSRREAMKVGLKAGAYAAPAVLSLSTVSRVAAATPPPFPTSIAFGQDAALTGAGPNVSFDVYYTPSNQPANSLTLLGTIATDRFGFGGGVFPLTLDARAVSSVKLTYVVAGNPSTSPPATTFTSALVAGLAPVNGARGPASFSGLVVQEPSVATCSGGPAGQLNETIDVAILNGPASTPYDFYVQPNIAPAPVKVATASTNAQGNVTVFATTPAPFASVATPTSVVVTAVLAGGSPATPAFTLTASGGTLITINCLSFTSASTALRPIGITP